MELYFLIFVVIGIPVIGGVISFMLTEMKDNTPYQSKVAERAWQHHYENTYNTSNKPNFRQRETTEENSLFEEEEESTVPEFSLDEKEEEIPEFTLEGEEKEIRVPDVAMDEETADFMNEKENTQAEPEPAFKHSVPTEDMEEGIEELLAKTTPENTQEEMPEGYEIPLPSDEDVPLEESFPLDEKRNSSPEEKEEPAAAAVLSPLGDNYYFVAREFGKKVANAVTASPDFALEQGVDYILLGKIEGEFFNSFGESLRLQGLPENYEADEYTLIKGTFITAELFYVIETLSAVTASNSEEELNSFAL